MIESKVIEKFMEDNGLEPYDVLWQKENLRIIALCILTKI